MRGRCGEQNGREGGTGISMQKIKCKKMFYYDILTDITISFLFLAFIMLFSLSLKLLLILPSFSHSVSQHLSFCHHQSNSNLIILVLLLLYLISFVKSKDLNQILSFSEELA